MDRNGSVRGQTFLWRYFLSSREQAAEQAPFLFEFEPPSGTLGFVPLEPISMESSVPENAWVKTDPDAARMKVKAEADPTLLMPRLRT